MSQTKRHLGLARSDKPSREVFRRRKRPKRWRQILSGLAFTAAGTGLLLALLQLPERLDTLLLVSKAIANLIGGLAQLASGLLQLVGVLVVVAVALGALFLVVVGLVRIVRALLPGNRQNLTSR
ncbi:MAG: hypothetical protein WCK64_14555 [Synechococcaceae cyanobacterium ELA445]|jgi:hypothetical protein